MNVIHDIKDNNLHKLVSLRKISEKFTSHYNDCNTVTIRGRLFGKF